MSQVDTVAGDASEWQTAPATINLPRRWLGTHEAADYVGISRHHLGKLRERRRGPPFRRFGRVVIYDVQELDAFMERLPRGEA